MTGIRYSAISKEGVSIAFNDSNNTFEGWKAMLDKANAWIQYNSVDFGRNNRFKSAIIRAFSKKGSTIQLRLNDVVRPVIAEIEIPESDDWNSIKAPLSFSIRGVQNLVVILNDNNPVEIDWVSFQ